MKKRIVGMLALLSLLGFNCPAGDPKMDELEMEMAFEASGFESENKGGRK